MDPWGRRALSDKVDQVRRLIPLGRDSRASLELRTSLPSSRRILRRSRPRRLGRLGRWAWFGVSRDRRSRRLDEIGKLASRFGSWFRVSCLRGLGFGLKTRPSSRYGLGKFGGFGLGDRCYIDRRPWQIGPFRRLRFILRRACILCRLCLITILRTGYSPPSGRIRFLEQSQLIHDQFSGSAVD